MHVHVKRSERNANFARKTKTHGSLKNSSLQKGIYVLSSQIMTQVNWTSVTESWDSLSLKTQWKKGVCGVVLLKNWSAKGVQDSKLKKNSESIWLDQQAFQPPADIAQSFCVMGE